jgi:hypothetical protein
MQDISIKFNLANSGGIVPGSNLLRNDMAGNLLAERDEWQA